MNELLSFKILKMLNTYELNQIYFDLVNLILNCFYKTKHKLYHKLSSVCSDLLLMAWRQQISILQCINLY